MIKDNLVTKRTVTSYKQTQSSIVAMSSVAMRVVISVVISAVISFKDPGIQSKNHKN